MSESTQRTEDEGVLEQYGGETTLDQLHRLLPDFPQVEGCRIILQNYFDYISGLENRRFSVGAYFVNSISMGCRIHRLTGGRAVIVMPVGAAVRLRSLIRLLLQYWNQKYNCMALSSPLDSIDEKIWQIPSPFRPLFGDYSDSEKEQFWQDIENLDKITQLSAPEIDEMANLLHLAVIHLFGHEFMHVWSRHFELRAIRPREPLLALHSLTDTELQKGIELHADSGASFISISILLGQLGSNLNVKNTESYEQAFYRIGYMTTMLYGLYDVRRKYLYSYQDSEYTHPVVRRELAANAMDISLMSHPALREIFRRVEPLGANRCDSAREDLNIDLMLGRFGPIDPNKLILPLHITKGFTILTLRNILDEIKLAQNILDRFVAFGTSYFRNPDTQQ